MVSPEPNQNPHYHSCRCNSCVARRNARRRLDEERHRNTDQPLPSMSQIYEIERDLPPVYANDVERRGAPTRRASSTHPLMDEFLDNLTSQRPPPIQPAVTPTRPVKQSTKRPIKQLILAVIIVLFLTLAGIASWWQYNRIGQLVDPGG